MKLPDPDNYVDKEDMIDEIVDEIVFRLSEKNTVRFIIDLLVQDGWVPLLDRADDEIQHLYDSWIGGDLRLNSFYGDDQEAQLELEMEARHG